MSIFSQKAVTKAPQQTLKMDSLENGRVSQAFVNMYWLLLFILKSEALPKSANVYRLQPWRML